MLPGAAESVPGTVMNGNETCHFAMFPAADVGNQLVIQSRSSVTDGTGAGMSRCLSNSVRRATTHSDNNGPTIKETRRRH